MSKKTTCVVVPFMTWQRYADYARILYQGSQISEDPESNLGGWDWNRSKLWFFQLLGLSDGPGRIHSLSKLPLHTLFPVSFIHSALPFLWIHSTIFQMDIPKILKKVFMWSLSLFFSGSSTKTNSENPTFGNEDVSEKCVVALLLFFYVKWCSSTSVSTNGYDIDTRPVFPLLRENGFKALEPQHFTF